MKRQIYLMIFFALFSITYGFSQGNQGQGNSHHFVKVVTAGDVLHLPGGITIAGQTDQNTSGTIALVMPGQSHGNNGNGHLGIITVKGKNEGTDSKGVIYCSPCESCDCTKVTYEGPDQEIIVK